MTNPTYTVFDPEYSAYSPEDCILGPRGLTADQAMVAILSDPRYHYELRCTRQGDSVICYVYHGLVHGGCMVNTGVYSKGKDDATAIARIAERVITKASEFGRFAAWTDDEFDDLLARVQKLSAENQEVCAEDV